MRYANRLGLNLFLTILISMLMKDIEMGVGETILTFVMIFAASILLLWSPGEKKEEK